MSASLPLQLSSDPEDGAASVPADHWIIRGFLSTDVVTLLRHYVLLKESVGLLHHPDLRVPDAPALYADPLTEALVASSQTRIEGTVGESLLPSYSYVRVHPHDSKMPAHTDRPASEVGVSIAVSSDSKWPLWLASSVGVVGIELEPGDAVVYLGNQVSHWREPFQGQKHIQLILFYVRAAGPYAQYAYDGRAGLGFPLKPVRRTEDVARKAAATNV